MFSRRLSTAQKYRICQLVFGAAFVITIFCLSRIAAPISPHAIRFWFGILVISVIVSLPFDLGFYYYRAKLRDIDSGALQVETLARTVVKPPAPHAGSKGKKD